MILLVSVENTRIMIGCADEADGMIIFEDSVATDLTKTAAEYAILFGQILALHGVGADASAGGILASCVAPLSDTVKNAMSFLVKNPILEVGPGVKTGVDIRIDDPAELGADLITQAAGALSSYEPPLIVINSATLLTFSVINRQGHYCGAVFAPGLQLSAETLSFSTASLPSAAIRPSRQVIGRHTVQSIQSGIFNGAASLIEGLAGRIEAELGESGVTTLISGEYAGEIVKLCVRPLIVDADLSARGLIAIYRKNMRARRPKV